MFPRQTNRTEMGFRSASVVVVVPGDILEMAMRSVISGVFGTTRLNLVGRKK